MKDEICRFLAINLDKFSGIDDYFVLVVCGESLCDDLYLASIDWVSSAPRIYRQHSFQINSAAMIPSSHLELEIGDIHKSSLTRDRK